MVLTDEKLFVMITTKRNVLRGFGLGAITYRIGVALLFFCIPFGLWAVQEIDSLSHNVYYERIDDGLIRFFYDKHYFLIDKNCQFKEIEREGIYDFASRAFVGTFRDYDRNGYLVLEGNYQNGLKEGVFRAYHPSGFLKWEIHYERDIPKDTLRFYYPDGKPYLEYQIMDNELLLWAYWDKKGRQRVEEGRGRFEVVSEVGGTYNPDGFQWVKRTGRVVDGKLDRTIPYRYIYDDGTEYAAGYEEYRNGEFIRGDDFATGEVFHTARFPIVPLVWHSWAEMMVSKRCTIDEHIGFTQHIADEWRTGLAHSVRATSDEEGNTLLYHLDNRQQWVQENYEPTDLGPRRLSFVLEVDKDGVVQSTLPDRNFDTPWLAEYMLAIVSATKYWVPSWDGEFIDDELTVELEVFVSPDEGIFQIHDLHVVRTNGS